MQSYTKKRKKGFTLTELAIVIAVIAILIAVLVPTFTTLIKKANTSADEQAVNNMNTALSIHEASESFETISDVVNALAADNYDLENYTPLISGMQFYWVKSINRIVYADSETHVVSFPEAYTSLAYDMKDGWYSLNGGIELVGDMSEVISGNTATISTGAQFATLMTNFSDYTAVTTITLTKDVDLMGASVNFGTVSSDVTISSSSGTCTIYGFRNDTNSTFGQGEFADKGYGYGLFADISSGTTVKISNVNFNGMVIEDTLKDNGTMALIAGYCHGTLELENVTFTDCNVKGKQKISTIVGQFLSGSVTLKNVDYVNTTVSASAEGTKVIAYIPSGTQSFSYDNACDFSGITVVGNDSFASYYEDLDYLGSATVIYTTASGNSYECLLANYGHESYKTYGKAMVVATQALYLYQVSSTQTTTDGYTYGVQIGSSYVRNTNTPGDASFESGNVVTANSSSN